MWPKHSYEYFDFNGSNKCMGNYKVSLKKIQHIIFTLQSSSRLSSNYDGTGLKQTIPKLIEL